MAPLDRLPTDVSAGEPQPPPSAVSVVRPPRRGAVVAAVVVAVAAVGALVWFVRGDNGQDSSPPAGGDLATTTAVPTTALPTTAAPVTTAPTTAAPTTVEPLPATTVAPPQTTVAAPAGEVTWRVAGDFAGGALSGSQVLALDADGVVRALATGDGAERWRYATGVSVVDGPLWDPVPSSSLVYLAAGTTLHAVDLATGAARWTADVGTPMSGPPLDAGPLVVVPAESALVAFDAADGTLRWRAAPGELFTRLALAESLVLAPAETRLYAYEVDSGAVRWRLDASATDAFYLLPTVADGIAYQPGGARLHAVEVATGEVRWVAATTGACAFTLPPAVVGDVVVAVDTVACGVARSDGSLVWTGDPLAVASDPVPSGEVVLVPTSEGVVAIEAASGATRWSAVLGADGLPGPPAVIGPAALLTSTGFESSALAAVAVDSGEVLWRVPLTGEAPLRAPLGGDGLVAVVTSAEVVAVT